MRIANLLIASVVSCLFNLLAPFAEYALLSALSVGTVWAAASVYGPKVLAYWDLLSARL